MHIQTVCILCSMVVCKTTYACLKKHLLFTEMACLGFLLDMNCTWSRNKYCSTQEERKTEHESTL